MLYFLSSMGPVVSWLLENLEVPLADQKKKGLAKSYFCQNLRKKWASLDANMFYPSDMRFKWSNLPRDGATGHIFGHHFVRQQDKDFEQFGKKMLPFALFFSSRSLKFDLLNVTSSSPFFSGKKVSSQFLKCCRKKHKAKKRKLLRIINAITQGRLCFSYYRYKILINGLFMVSLKFPDFFPLGFNFRFSRQFCLSILVRLHDLSHIRFSN